ncbi:protoporphyrinogen oxidase HemJ [Abyssibius alkaniclasticus]|uniref:protoporphyrinogen oxidase HemJ n=1 Tax=Abyssibius alkaniclasticus TaxID=2881234 RepID=UPI002363CC5F|nr:protoporphyrinogen oxidase HemJ [Abyssibius alkaniclasticus]UPH72000.1 protoporphyrinogen oxidase HemJ [Abyssibius alkaniclasticus]
MITDFLADAYRWILALHIMSVIAWMAGMFYLPRLFVYHAERAPVGSEQSEIFKVMELKLLRVIINPAMLATWFFGLCLVFTPGVVDWGQVWPWVKAAMVLAMSGFHGWLSTRRKEFARDENTRSGKTYRLANELPTVLMAVIVIMVVIKPF